MMLAGCNGALLLPKGEKLYNGAKLKVKKQEKKWDTAELEAALPQAIVLPRKNRHLLWLRPKVGIYNVFHNRKKEKGFRNWVANQLGTPPVLMDSSIIEAQRERIASIAANYGFFEVQVQTKKRGLWRKKKLKHVVRLMAPAKKLMNLTFPPDTGAVEHRLLQLKQSSLLVLGKNYQLQNLSLERQRLADSLRNDGWFFLSPDHLFFVADTLQSDSSALGLELRFKGDVTEAEKRRYRIEKIVIRPDYDVKSQSDENTQQVVIDSCKTFIFKELNLKKKLILDNIRFSCGEYFSNEKYRETLFRLLNLQYFKFVNIRFDASSNGDSLLVANVLLTPAIPQKVETSLSAIFSPGLYFGAQSGVKWQHRNLFGSGEQMSVAWEGSMLRVSDEIEGKYWLYGSDTKFQMTLPQKIPGLRIRKRNALTATRFSLEHQVYFWKYDIGGGEKLGIGFHSVDANGSFIWKKNRQGTVTHELTPIGTSIKFATLSIPNLKEILLQEIPSDTTGVYISFATYLELRPSYTFNYDNRLGKARDLSTNFRQTIMLRANGYRLPSDIAKAADLGRPVNLITETNFSQYLNLNKKTVLAWRLGASAMVPLTGESYFYIFDQYAIGGASSVRAFSPRTIGPGATPLTGSGAGGSILSFTNHSGNILLLTSLELRRSLGKSWELASFFDAGNVWLVQAINAEQADGVFSFGKFYEQLASGAGLGIRYNLGFFTLRLDVAAPLSKPYLPSGSRYVGQPDFGSLNLRWNLAFGYPF